MFNKTIFKHSLKENFKIWLIITVVLSLINVALIAVFDPKTISTMTDMVKGTPFENMLANTSFLGMLSQTYYSIHSIILILIYIIITASNLIVSKVDRGSMAYLLSTQTKRSVVVRTQAIYFVSAVFSMVTIATLAGIFSIQVFHGGVWGTTYTEDVKAVSDELNLDKTEVADNLHLILDNDNAIKIGADTREMDKEEYTAYLNLKITNNAYKAAADIMEIDVDAITNDPSLIKDNDEALTAAAKVMDMDKEAYSAYIDKSVLQKEALTKQAQEMQDKLLKGVTAAAKVLDMESGDLLKDMAKIKKSKEALNAAVKEAGIPEEIFVQAINSQIATNAISEDNGIDFSINDYLILNVGLFLLLFATSGISFMFSCIFNLSKNYMALGAGIPIAFFIFHMMAQVSESLEAMKYITMNSLFDTNAILTGGEYKLQFIALGVIGVVLYVVGMKIFKEKDLPL